VYSLAGPKAAVVEEPGEILAVEAAFEAWGRWAGDGNMSYIFETFADGPQLAQIRLEDPKLVLGPSYEFELVGATVPKPGLVRGTVLLGRPGEAQQRFQWDIELVQVDGAWRLWTIRTTAAG
jgi:hypothetical protein